MVEIFDSHAHLDDEQFKEGPEAVIDRALANGITWIINPGCDLSSSKKAVEYAKKYEMIYAAVGFHPHEASMAKDEDYDMLAQWCSEDKVVAVGEIGLDYYYNLSPKDVQQRTFAKQLDLARQVHKPVIIHDRDAHADTLRIIKKEGQGVHGVFHCYSGSLEMAKELLKMGYYISFAGPLTFKNAAKLREVAAFVPLDRILIETDSPYLTPVPYRGHRNEPCYVRYVFDELVKIKDCRKDVLAAQLKDNMGRLFNIK